MQESRFRSAFAALSFAQAGNAIFTLRSATTGTRYTYKVRVAKNNPSRFFVSLLVGPNNEGDYQYIGLMENGQFRLTPKSRMQPDSTPVVAFQWTLKQLTGNYLPKTLEIWHEGRCGRCGRLLTVPESIANGIGPECSKMMAAA